MYSGLVFVLSLRSTQKIERKTCVGDSIDVCNI